MPRPRIPRRILLPPRFLTFKPMGVPRRLLQRVTLSVDEFEAIRLADHERLDHLEAAARMGISRSTFSRLIDSAHGKVAACIIEGRELRIEGGEGFRAIAAALRRLRRRSAARGGGRGRRRDCR